MRLKHACVDGGQYGVNVSPSEYRASGTRMIRTSDLAGRDLIAADKGVFLEFAVPQAQVLQEHDLLLSRAGTIGRSYLVPTEAAGMTFAGFLVRFRPASNSDPRFLQYAILSKPVQEQISSQAVTSTIQNFNADRYANLEIPDVPEFQQGRIADFLDDRVSRIDRIIAARCGQVDLANRHFRATLEKLIWTTDASVQLKHLLVDVTSGPRGWGDLVGDQGVPFVRIGNLSRLGIELQSTVTARLTPPENAEAARAALVPGDVLLSITAAFGEVGVWRGGAGTFSQHVARLRPRSASDSDWIAWTLQTYTIHDQYRLHAYGGTKIGMGLEQVRSLAVPASTPHQRRDASLQISEEWSRFTSGAESLAQCINLLTEYKTSLITAAVTGELDVTTAGSNIPG